MKIPPDESELSSGGILMSENPKYSACLAHSHLAGLLRPGVAAGIGERVDDDGCQVMPANRYVHRW